MQVGSKNYRTIEASKDQSYVKIIDQTYLPFKLKIVHLKTLDEVIKAIINMQVRGAPLIGVTAAYGFAILMNFDSSNNALKKCKKDLVNARPTAVNLSSFRHHQFLNHLCNQSRFQLLRCAETGDVTVHQNYLGTHAVGRAHGR